MWSAITYVTGPVTLVAFVAAVGAWVYRRKLTADAEQVRTVPDSERSRIVLARYGVSFDVDTAPLTKQQKVDTINRQIEAAAAKFRTVAVVVVIVAVLFFLATVILSIAAMLGSSVATPMGQAGQLEFKAIEVIPQPTSPVVEKYGTDFIPRGPEQATFRFRVYNPGPGPVVITEAQIIPKRVAVRELFPDANVRVFGRAIQMDHHGHIPVTFGTSELSHLRYVIPLKETVPPNDIAELVFWFRHPLSGRIKSDQFLDVHAAIRFLYYNGLATSEDFKIEMADWPYPLPPPPRDDSLNDPALTRDAEVKPGKTWTVVVEESAPELYGFTDESGGNG